MKIIKENEKILIIDQSGSVIAYLEKNGFGTHGHYRGYKHFIFSAADNKYIWCGVEYYCKEEKEFKRFTDKPETFRNLKEVKLYYNIA